MSDKKPKPLKILCHKCEAHAFDFVGKVLKFNMGIRSRDFVFPKTDTHPGAGDQFACRECGDDLVYKGREKNKCGQLLTNKGLRPERV